jgi:hypothetical protein
MMFLFDDFWGPKVDRSMLHENNYLSSLDWQNGVQNLYLLENDLLDEHYLK